MFRLRLRVRALSREEYIEFEKVIKTRSLPYRGWALAEGPAGEHEPLFVKEITETPQAETFIVQLEDDMSRVEAGAALVAALYTQAGWRERRRYILTPQTRKAAS